MGRPFIVLGDRTSHGGVVVEASQLSLTHNKPIARVGDQVTCPIPGHGTTVIVEGDPTMIIDGKPAARHGDKCACGATLISGQVVSTVGGNSAGGAAQSGSAARGSSPVGANAAAAGVVAVSQNSDEEILEQYFSLTDEDGNPISGYRYDLFQDGAVRVRSGDFTTGDTAAVAGQAEMGIVYWLNKTGTTKS